MGFAGFVCSLGCGLVLVFRVLSVCASDVCRFLPICATLSWAEFGFRVPVGYSLTSPFRLK